MSEHQLSFDFIDTSKQGVRKVKKKKKEQPVGLVVKRARVGVDGHIQFNKHLYSVPLAEGTAVTVIANEFQIDVQHNSTSIVVHSRKYASGFSTLQNHIGRSDLKWNRRRLTSWARSIGPGALEWAEAALDARDDEQQAIRTVLSVLSLSRKYNSELYNTACLEACDRRKLSAKAFKQILERLIEFK